MNPSGNPTNKGRQPPVEPLPQQAHSTVVGSGTSIIGHGNVVGNVINPPGKTGIRLDTKVLGLTLLADVAFFFYGMLSYTGRNTSGDEWRAGIFIVLFSVTIGMIRRWFRRRV